jgi:hypothetical protein
MPMRDRRMTQAYFDGSIEWYRQAIKKNIDIVATTPGHDPKYRAQFIFQIFLYHCELLITLYSRGDDLAELKAFLPEVVKAWDQAYEAELKVFTPEEMAGRKQFSQNLDIYIVCFWLFSIAVCLESDEALLQRMLKLIGNEGEDALFDRCVAKRFPGRKIGDKLLYARPYQPLLDVLDATKEKQATLIQRFLKNWYEGCKKTYWYNSARDEDSGYFGFWSFEAALAVKLWDMDDSSFADHPNYPGDLVRGKR